MLLRSRDRLESEYCLPYSQVTPKREYFSRRRFWQATAGWLAAGFAGAAPKLGARKSSYSTDEKPTPYGLVTSYNNFYEFSTEKEEPARLARNFRTLPWKVSVEGLAARPRVFDFEEIVALAPLEERIYRHRCVEGWSMVIPWVGFPLSVLLKQVGPLPQARYVAFQSYYDPRQMPGGREAGIPFPYREGLRLDEAMHPLAILCVGVYNEWLPKQCGAPLRVVVPWKYGFKSIKSIVRIRLVEKQPQTTWHRANPLEYGFYANVNPGVDHPRWSQARERRLGESGERLTLPFNGYENEVRSLYAGMDLRRNY